ncbi:hypothetical protein Tco_0553167, partial [Tanacetum coccineum]
FLSPKRREKGNGVNEKHDLSTNDPSKNKNNVVADITCSLNVDISLDQNFGSIPSLNSLDGSIGKNMRSLLIMGLIVESKRVSSKDGMDAMIENGPWLIRNVPIIQTKSTPDVNIMKEDVCHIPIWNLKNPSKVVRGVQSSASSSGKKKYVGLSRQAVSNSNSFDALDMVKNDDELGTNGGILMLAEKGAESSSDAFSSPNTTPLAARINDLERQMLDGKLVLMDDDGKLQKRDFEDPYDDDDFDHLTDAQMKFANSFDISLRGQLR